MRRIGNKRREKKSKEGEKYNEIGWRRKSITPPPFTINTKEGYEFYSSRFFDTVSILTKNKTDQIVSLALKNKINTTPSRACRARNSRTRTPFAIKLRERLEYEQI